MKIYNKKEQAEKEKCKMFKLRRKGAPRRRTEPSPMSKETQKMPMVNGVERMMRPGQEPHPAKLPTSVGGIVAPSSNPQKTEVGGSLGSGPVWSTKQVPGQSSLCSKKKSLKTES